MENLFKKSALGAAFVIATAPAFGGFAQAQDNSLTQGDSTIEVESEKKIIADAETADAVKKRMSRDTGWYPKLRIGGSASVNYNKDVDGVNDGTAFTFGLYLKGAIDGVYKYFEWQNKLEIEHQQTKLPTIDDFIKTTDKFDFQTLALFRIPQAEWVGPFARFRLQTSLFPGYYISDKDTTVRYYQSTTKIDEKSDDKFVEGKAPQELAAQKSVKLSSAFEPLLLSESAGFFFNPYENEMLSVNVKLGAAGQHLIADGGYVSFDDDDDDSYYDVRQLVDTHSVGVEGELELKGVFVGYVNWSLVASLYYPCAVNDDRGLDGADLIHSDITAKISVKLASWASLDYALIAKRAPFVTTDWQITNTILFTLGFDVFK